MAESLLALAVGGALVVVLLQAGTLVLRPLQVRYHDRVERACFGFATGMGLAGYMLLGVGLLGGYRGQGFVPVLLLLVGMAVWETALERRGREQWPQQPRTARFLYPAMAVLGAPLLIAALAPPTGADWDSLAYHLAMPRLYLDHGRIFYVNFAHQSNFPFTMEMIYGLCLFLQGAEAARVLHLATWMFSGIAVFALGRRLLNPVAGAYATVVYLTIPLAQWQAATAYVDIPNAFFCFLAVYAVLAWWDKRDTRWLLLGGGMLGLALGTKMSAWALWGVLILVVFYLARKGKSDWAGSARQALLHVGLVAAVIGSPWYIKSAVWTGNPVYPFFYGVFDGRNWDQEAAAPYREAQLKMGAGRGVEDLLALPVRLTYQGERFYDNPQVFASPGPLFLAFLPLLLLWRPAPRELKAALLVSLGLLIYWFISMQQMRYLYPALALASLPAGAAAWHARERTFGLQIAVGFVTGLHFGLVLLLSLVVNGTQAPVALGSERRTAFLRATFPPYAAMEYLNRLPGEVKVATYGEPRCFYLRRPYLYGERGHHTLIDYGAMRTGEELVSALRRLGVTHLLVNRQYFTPDIASGQSNLGEPGAEAVRLGLIVGVFERNGVVVYRVE